MKTLLPVLLCMGIAIGASAQTGAYNLDFENWQGVYPSGFMGTGLSKQTSGAYSGTNYVRLTVANPSAGICDGFLINSTNTKLGTPYSNMPTAVSGYYRTMLAGTDSVYVVVNFKKNGTILNGPRYTITNSEPNWTLATIPISLSQAPDSVVITFIANKGMMAFGQPGNNGTEFDIDAWQIISPATGIVDFSQYDQLSSYPNPAATDFYIKTQIHGPKTIEIYDLNGRLVGIVQTEEDTIRIDVSTYAPGLYIYKLNSAETGSKTAKIVVQN